MSVGSLLRSSYLLYFSQPAQERALLKAVKSRPVRSIVELGIGFSGRTEKLLEVAAWRGECLPLRYTGIDLFEARGKGAGPTLKQAFARFKLPHAKVQLVPGDPHAALVRVANALVGTDLLLIAAEQDRAALDRSWAWMPRMLTADSLIFEERPGAKAGETCWQPLTLAEIQRRAAEAARMAKRAA